MCDSSGKLIAFLDHELAESEAADIERHLQTCAECRRQLKVCRQTSRAVEEYCDAVLASQASHSLPRWAPAFAAAATAAAAVALFLVLSHPRTQQLPAPAPIAAEAPVTSVKNEAAAAHASKAHSRRVAATAHGPSADWGSTGPAIEVSIPADAVFPPGAVPEGVEFIANVSLAPDGSIQRVSLR